MNAQKSIELGKPELYVAGELYLSGIDAMMAVLNEGKEIVRGLKITRIAKALQIYVVREKSNTFGGKHMSLPHDITNEELISLVRQRSERGFTILYDNYSAALFGVIGRIVSDTGAAEDVLQETFVKIWKSIEQYDDCKGTFFTWMLNIARHTSIDYIRSKQYIQRQKNNSNGISGGPESSPVSPENIEHIGVQKMVSKMDEQYSEVINLLYFNGYTQEEVAEALNIPLGTVKTRARKALQILRNQF